MRYFRRNAKRSWHDYAFTSRGGQTKARCGYWLRDVPEWTDDYPPNDKTCNRCLALTRNDAENVPADDEVPTDPTDDPVPA